MDLANWRSTDELNLPAGDRYADAQEGPWPRLVDSSDRHYGPVFLPDPQIQRCTDFTGLFPYQIPRSGGVQTLRASFPTSGPGKITLRIILNISGLGGLVGKH